MPRAEPALGLIVAYIAGRWVVPQVLLLFGLVAALLFVRRPPARLAEFLRCKPNGPETGIWRPTY